MCEELTCPKCGQKLSTGDYGWYCSNQYCSYFDLDIEAYGDTCDVAMARLAEELKEVN